MAGRCSFLPLARLLLLAVVLGAALHGEVAVAMPLRGIAEPPASPGAVAEGPGDAAQAGAGGGGSPDRSEAGGEVILAGFAAAVIIVVFCYIRVTRESSSSNSNNNSVGDGEKKESLGAF
ncbi:unnamed protein product [Urochloa humidicola]